MRPDNRYAQKTLAQLAQSKMALVAVCRRCKHQRVLYPKMLIERFGENFLAIKLRPFLRCSECRYGSPNLHESSR